MKKSNPIDIIIIVCIIIFSVNNNAQGNPDTYKKLGIISRLVEIKHISEANLISVLNDTQNTQDEKNITIKNYNIIRFYLDRIIFQLISDMETANSAKIFKKLNVYYKKYSFSDTGNISVKLKPYRDALFDLFKKYEIYLNPNDA